MNVLLIEGDREFRELLAAVLTARGHRVHAAAGVDEGLRALRSTGFDAVITAWELGDDDASAIVASAHGPCVVLGDRPENVVDHPAIAALLAKPVAPAKVAAVLADLEGHGKAGPCPEHSCVESLPADTRDRVRAVLAILDDPAGARVDDDGVQVTIEGHLTSPERWVALLDGIGGDLRVISDVDDEDAPLRMVLRLDRRGLPADVEIAVGPADPWPQAGPFAIDFDGAEVSPDRFLALCDQVRHAGRHGRAIDLVNVPAHLRMCVEAVGRADDLPMRRTSGPRLPEVLDELWR